MPLIEITQVKKVNIVDQQFTQKRKYIKYIPSTPYSYKPEPGVVSQAIRMFKYEYEHSYLPPTLFIDSNGNKYIVPIWKKVHPQTTYNDIKWIKPTKPEPPKEKNTWKFESSSDPGSFYFVKQSGSKLTCSCSGFWRAKDRRCKHIKEVEQKLS